MFKVVEGVVAVHLRNGSNIGSDIASHLMVDLNSLEVIANSLLGIKFWHANYLFHFVHTGLALRRYVLGGLLA